MRVEVWMAVVAAVMSVGINAQTAGGLPSMQFSHRVVVDQDDVFVLLWTPREDVIEFEMQVRVTGYAGIGFSPNGGMRGADIVVGWVDDAGQVFLQDRYAEDPIKPQIDESQDVRLLSGYQNDTHTVLRFSRPWKTLDIKDYMLGEDTVRVIWCYGYSDPANPEDLRYHDKRGTISLYLKAPQMQLPPMDSAVKTMDFLSYNVTIPSDLDTVYWCMMYKLPDITTKHHIIGYIPLLQKENLEHVHHLVVYECNVPEHGQYYEQWLEWEGTQCHSPNMPPSWRFCTNALFAWAVGGEGEMFPEHVGYPIGESGTTTYFMMEVHYDNPKFRQGVADSSGIRLFYTDKLRQYDAGTMIFGHGNHLIVPGGQMWQSSGYCDSSCTRQHLPPEGVQIFQGLLHAHLLGRTLTLRHGRNGQELQPVMTDMNYDFDYQNTRILEKEVTLLPGDSLIVDCGYNSTHRTSPTYGGLGTNEEMCLAFMAYYPRIDLTYCGSQPDVDSVLGALGIEQATNVDLVDEILSTKAKMDEEIENKLLDQRLIGNLSIKAEDMVLAKLLDEINVTAPQKFFNRSLYNILEDKATWMDGTAANALQETVLTGNHYSVCNVRSDGLMQKSDKIITAPRLKALHRSLPAVKFMHSIVLDQQGSYVMLWTPREKDIVFEVQVGTTGYVGLGFSPGGGMTGADIVLGWVDSADKVFLHDRYAEGNQAPVMDASQDVTLLGGYQNDTHTVLRFSRPWNTCDEAQDYILTDDTVRVIWAYSDRDPARETDLHYHQARGTKSLYLKSPQFDMPPLGPDVKTWDFLSPNVSLPDNLDTLYWCKVFKIPPITKKNHMIGFVPVIQEGNEEHVHHILMYGCYVPKSEMHFEHWLDWQGTQCYSANMPTSWNYCKSLMIGWAVGGNGEMFPQNAGYPLGEEYEGPTYFVMETHYDNPNLRRGVVDSSGLRIFYTEKLREHDAGLLMVGHKVSPFHIIPPRQPRFLTATFCDSSCMAKSLPSSGVSVFQGVLHTHLLGAAIVVRHIRNGQELPVLLKDMNYDFNYQSTRVFKQEIKLLPGDILLTECYYDSSNRTVPTFGGLGTQEEMCLAFLSYYPRVDLYSCLSQPQMKDVIASLGIEKVSMSKKGRRILEKLNYNPVEKQLVTQRPNSVELKPIRFSDFHRTLRITAPEKYLNMTVYDILHADSTWQDPTVIDSFQRMTTTGVHMTACETRGENLKEVENLVSFPSFWTLRQKPDQCYLLKDENSWTDVLCPSMLPSCRNTRRQNILF